VQEVPYRSLLRRTRQHYHRQVAEPMETRFPDLVQTEPELVAHRYTEAGCTEQALPYWQRAGQQALQRSANLEAVRRLTTALELLVTCSDTSTWAQQELELQIALGQALMATKGYTAPEVEQTYARARALCQQVPGGISRSGAPSPSRQPSGTACAARTRRLGCRQQAKSWELRTALSLSRLWQQEGKRAEAYELLAPIYGWFTEGFDTADLQDAKALLEELA